MLHLMNYCRDTKDLFKAYWSFMSFLALRSLQKNYLSKKHHGYKDQHNIEKNYLLKIRDNISLKGDIMEESYKDLKRHTIYYNIDFF